MTPSGSGLRLRAGAGRSPERGGGATVTATWHYHLLRPSVSLADVTRRPLSRVHQVTTTVEACSSGRVTADAAASWLCGGDVLSPLPLSAQRWRRAATLSTAHQVRMRDGDQARHCSFARCSLPSRAALRGTGFREQAEELRRFVRGALPRATAPGARRTAAARRVALGGRVGVVLVGLQAGGGRNAPEAFRNGAGFRKARVLTPTNGQSDASLGRPSRCQPRGSRVSRRLRWGLRRPNWGCRGAGQRGRGAHRAAGTSRR